MSTRVLVVDDEMDTLNLLRTILEISGYEPITTLNSVEALELAKAEAPDVVLLDIMMPRLDGFELCKMMRAHAATCDLPIIFVTAYEALDLDDRRRDAGADLVIRKPINVDGLVESIAEARLLRRQDAASRPAASGNGASTPSAVSGTGTAGKADDGQEPVQLHALSQTVRKDGRA